MPTRGPTLESSAPPMDARNQHTPPARGPGWLHAHRSEKAAGRLQPPPVGGSRRGPPSPRCSSPFLQRPPEPARGPRQRRAPTTLPPRVFGPHFLVPRRPLFDATGTPRGEGGLTSAAGANQRLCPRVLARRARFRVRAGRRKRMPGSRGRWARLTLAGLGWALLGLCSGARPTSTKEWRALPGQRLRPAI